VKGSAVALRETISGQSLSSAFANFRNFWDYGSLAPHPAWGSIFLTPRFTKTYGIAEGMGSPKWQNSSFGLAKELD